MSAPSAWRSAAEIARSGVLAVLVHPLSSATTVLCLVVLLAPLTAGLGMSAGVARDVETSIERGADLYVTALRFGAPAPVPLSVVPAVREVPGVRAVEARIVGATAMGAAGEPVVVIGLAPERLQSAVDLVEGRLCRPGSETELVLGTELAARLGLEVGSQVLPFYRNPAGERIARVVGLFRSDLPLWQAHAAVTSFDFAAAIFAEEGTATSLLVTTAPGHEEAVRAALSRALPEVGDRAAPVRWRIVSRTDVAHAAAQRRRAREGSAALLQVLALSVGIPLVLVGTGIGLAERRAEAALLKALGWRTDEVLLRSFVESLVLAAAGASLALLATWVWVRGLSGAGLAAAFVPDADRVPAFDMPFRLDAGMVLLAAGVAVAVTSVGTLWSSWRAASAPPAELLR